MTMISPNIPHKTDCLNRWSSTGIAIARPGRHYKPAAGSRRVLKCQRHPDKTGRPTAATSPQHSNVSLLIAATHATAASNTP